MAIPPRPPAPPPALRSNPETFSANAEATILYQWGAFPAWLERIARFTESQAEAALTAALGGALPPLAGKAGQFLRVKEDGSGPELVARPAGDQLEAAGTGIMVKTSGGVVARSLTSGGNNGIQILYGSGSAGDPTINGITRTQAQWDAGADTTEAVISPAKLQGKVAAMLPTGLGQAAWAAGTSTEEALISPAKLAALLTAPAARAVGSHALARRTSGTAANIGDTLAGSALAAANANGDGSSNLSGTWICLGYSTDTSSATRTTLWRRIS
ncbi:hypothetical protein [Cereibacter sphaeroides]|uniref:hypothetical protein n=1 Tax=Cereibacter sphaeroides TaxID=1063 RepID=UPI003FCEE3E9